MRTSPRDRLLLGLTLLTVAAGLLDAVAAAVWDLAVVLAIIAVLVVSVVLGRRTDRRTVTVRPDLGAWIHRHAAATGEPVDRVVDRAVAAHLTGRDGAGP
jgi:Flp pilus assembly protein TadB